MTNLITNIFAVAVSATNSLSPMTPQEKTDVYIQKAEYRIESDVPLVRLLAIESTLDAVKEINARLTVLENMKNKEEE